jgi:RimJ/RimL family protein N-acetyltransferase
MAMRDAPILEGAIVRLEPLSRDHLDGLIAAGVDPELWRFTTSRVHSPDEMRGYVEQALAERNAGTSLPFATIHRATGNVIGSTRFGNITTDHRRCEIGWTWISRPWQRSAVNTEAKYLMLRHAFEQWQCIRVELKTSARNERSRRAILRIGATEEGTLRQHMINADGSLRDTVYFSILDREWPAVKARLESMLTGSANVGSGATPPAFR